MLIAYLILAHRYPGQLRRLAGRLSTGSTALFIHLDAKVSTGEAFYNLLKDVPNTHFIEKRVNVNWGGFSMVEATLNGLKEIVDTGMHFDYVTLMSGQDYPIRDNGSIMRFYADNRGREFIQCMALPSNDLPNGGMDRIFYYYDYDNPFSRHFMPEAKVYELAMRERGIKRDFIPGMLPYGGSQWWSLTFGCVKYILDKVDTDYEIINFYRYTKFPDEQFFQTVVMNSPFGDNVLNNSIWYIDWSKNNWKNINWVTAMPHPKTLDITDYEKLKTSDKLYARKFDMAADEKIMDLIDQTML